LIDFNKKILIFDELEIKKFEKKYSEKSAQIAREKPSFHLHPLHSFTP